MKSIISINKKFMEYTPYELINIIKNNSKYIDGFEIYIDYHNQEENEYLKELANYCKKYNYHFQVHGNSSLSVEEQLNFLTNLEEISDFLEYKINVVLHSKNAPTNEESIKLTTEYTTEITERINNSKLIISLENLNDIPEEDRLNIDQVTPIVANNENLYLTYDIGHEIADFNNVTSINQNIIPIISNVHIHSNNYLYSGGFDHKPIFKGDINWNEIIKSILFLKNNNYDNTIVFEYDLFMCPGETIEEKIISYCKSIDYVSERFK